MSVPKPSAPKIVATPSKNIETRNDKKNRPLVDHPGLAALKRTLDLKYPNNR